MKIKLSRPITSWEIEGIKVKAVRSFILGASKITADGDCSHEIQGCLLLGRKAKTNLDSKLKNWDITLPVKFHIVKAIVFPVVVYGCVSWTMKKTDCQRIDIFELWCKKKCLRVPWTARRSKQPILKEINPEYALEDCWWMWVSNTLDTWWEELTLWKRPWFWERWNAKEVSSRGWDG